MKNNTIPKCGIYKYVYHNEIIYIGKSDSSILDRIMAHETEEKFQPYLSDVDIYYFECTNPAETTIYETALINKYRPILNIVMKYESSEQFEIQEKEWKKFQKDNIVMMKNLLPHEQHKILCDIKRNIIVPFQNKQYSPEEMIKFTSDSPLPYYIYFPTKRFRLVIWYTQKESTYVSQTKWKYIQDFINFWQQQWLQDSDKLYEEYYIIQSQMNELMQQLQQIQKALNDQIISF